MATAMDIDPPTSSTVVGKLKSSDDKKQRFEVKKWNAVALWAWGQWQTPEILWWTIAPSAGTTSWTCASTVKRTKGPRAKDVRSLGGFVIRQWELQKYGR
ncbi:hypothetical protein P7C73_g6399, partial [Tremellales sp. Uapishka_1]